MINLEEEVLEGYTVTRDMKKLWSILFELLTVFKDICERHELKWFVSGGTLLGTIRHGGFIPWDDDIDVDMPREDFEKFIQIAGEELTYPYEMEYGVNGIWCKLRDARSSFVQFSDFFREKSGGCWIDIFPLDAVVEEENLHVAHENRMAECRGRFLAKTYSSVTRCWDNIWFEKDVSDVSDISQKQLFEEYRSACMMGNALPYERTFTHGLPDGLSNKSLYVKDYEHLLTKTFHDLEVYVPEGYDRCLTILYGDYMKFPPVEKRSPKHFPGFVFDPWTPYRKLDYSRFLSFPKELCGKQVICFGSGYVFNDFMERYGKDFDVEAVIDNNASRWGSHICGVEVKPPAWLEEIYPARRERIGVLVTSGYFAEMEKQLCEMGIEENQVFISDRIYHEKD